ncbi:MAG: TonB-dependent receptor [Myxococcales bacterium]|nr:TonB-dependent receptor [Myxococcales bacterium]
MHAAPPPLAAPLLLGAALALSPPAWSAPVDDEPVDDEIYVYGQRPDDGLDASRAVQRTGRKDLDLRQPQSTPEALRFSAGVFVQQTAHGQGSPYLRGLTGQHTLLLFDGLRLNHALFRKGPNQYLFTVDPRTLDSISVLRGSAGVLLGSDAIAGAILLRPVEPAIDPTHDGFVLRPKLAARHRTADGELGGRLQLDVQISDWLGVLFGVGARQVDRLEAGGDAFPDGRAPSQVCEDILTVPCFEPNGRTQLGTGFDELTADARVVALVPDGRATLAAYLYRQYDAPRTDQCPPPEAATNECLVFEEQFRTHVYGKFEYEPETLALRRFETALSYQRQHQRHRLARADRTPGDGIDTSTTNLGRDGVDGLSGYWRAETAPLLGVDWLDLRLRYGLDGSREWVDSAKWIAFASPPITRALSRGQYIDGSTLTQLGLYIAPEAAFGDLRLRGGARISHVIAASPGDPETASATFKRRHTPVVFNGGLQWGERVMVVANIEQGFRAPNLDDLTARQSTGQGYQLDNPNLRPERSLSLDAGLRLHLGWLNAELMAFHVTLDDAIERRLLSRDECKLSETYSDGACRANRAPLALVNLSGVARLVGGEALLEVEPWRALRFKGTVACAWGEGDNPGDGGPARVPLSRVPPLNGTGEVLWQQEDGLYAGAAVRWATAQDRLSPGDVADARIPKGGTPGFVVFDARAGLRLPRRLLVALVFENLTDARYRAHGSGVYSPGRSLTVNLEWEP